MEVLHAGIQSGVHLHPVAVEFQLRGVEQRLHGGKAGHHVVHRLHEGEDVHHGPVGHGRGDVAGHGVGQRGLQVGAGQLLGPGALAV